MSRSPVAITITDTHLHKENGEQVIDIFNQCFDLAQELKVKKVFHVGDFFTNRMGQTLRTLKIAKKIFKEAKRRKIELHIIAGNHDKTDQTIDDSYIDIFEYEGVYVYDSGWGYLDLENMYVFFIPYYTTEKYIQILDDLCTSIMERQDLYSEVPLVLLTHQAIDSVINNDGSRVESDIKIGLFDQFTNVLVGHYHNKQQISDNITYIGSSHPQNFGEDNDKGFTILYEDGSIEHIVAQFPQYHKFYFDCKEKQKIEEHFQQYKNSNDFVRFIFQGSVADFVAIDENKFKQNRIDVKFENKEQLKYIESVENSEYIEFDKKEIMKSWIEYCKLNDVPVDKRNRGMKLIQNNVVSE
jgi:exonuclease SbcD